MNKEEMKAYIQQQLSQSRYEHTLRVTEEAIKLANTHDVSIEKAELAALWHDVAKEFPRERLKQMIETSDLPKDVLDYHHELWHGPVASLIVSERFGIDDSEIISAVRYHTTGKAQMSSLDLVIFVADYIEPGRSFPGLDEVRRVAYENLQLAAWLVSRNTINYLMSKKSRIYPDTWHAYNDLTKILFEEKA